MNAVPCRPAALAYNDRRGVRNLVDGHRPVISGIFVCTPAMNPPMVGGLGNIRNTQRRLNAVLNLRPPITGQPVYLRNVEETHHGQQ